MQDHKKRSVSDLVAGQVPLLLLLELEMTKREREPGGKFPHRSTRTVEGSRGDPQRPLARVRLCCNSNAQHET